MRMLALAALLSALCFNTVLAQSRAGVACLDTALVQASMTSCAAAASAEGAARLDALLAELRDSVGAERGALLADAHVAWQTYRERQCVLEASSARGGSMYPMTLAFCRSTKNEARIAELTPLRCAPTEPCDTPTRFPAKSPPAKPSPKSAAPPLQLGNFSVSLAVKDIAASRAFYEALGFRLFTGNDAQRWLILQNETSTIGLFQGMFPRNMLTFNPGWDRNAEPLVRFDDVRGIQRALKRRGIALTLTADEATTGPASIMVTDPDGNPILIDQHVPAPKWQ